MNKKLILQIFSISLIILLISLIILLMKTRENNNLKNNLNNSWITEENTWVLLNWLINEEDIKNLTKNQIDSKIITLKRKFSLKWLIEKWDIYFKQEEYSIALTKFIQILKEIPNDYETINKIWNIYYELKKFDKAYYYYKQIKNYVNLDKQRAINSLIFSYTNKFSKENLNYIIKEINKFKLDEKQFFYYKNSLSCIEDFSICKLNFQNYLKQEETQTWIIEWTWILNIEKNSDLLKIKDAIINYDNFKLEDLSYKNALISWAFFSNWLYPIAIETSKKILIEKPNYKPILKILAKSYYELWLFEEAKNFLIQYNKIDEEDPEISYFLWVIYQKLHDYVISSIHLKKSIELWYSNSIEARRRIIFNYSEVWETEKMLKSFQELISNEKKNLKIEDLSLAIYFHIINSKLKIAKDMTNFAINNFEDKAIFYWYLWWINLEENWKVEWSLELSEKNLQLAYQLNDHNSMINYLLWLIESKKWNTKKALEYFKTSINLDEKWEFWIRAKNILKTINN